MRAPFARLLLATEHSKFDSGADLIVIGRCARVGDAAQKVIGLVQCPLRAHAYAHAHNPKTATP